MRKFLLIPITIICAVTLIAVEVSAQQKGMGQGGRGWGSGSPYERSYDPQSVETISGVVVSIGKFSPTKGSSYGVHAILKTDKETISVHLGPSWFVDNLEPQLVPEDRVEIKGSRIAFGGKPAIIAAEIRKGNATLTLRDGSGVPVWSGWRRR
jgi:hypothetical protein